MIQITDINVTFFILIIHINMTFITNVKKNNTYV